MTPSDITAILDNNFAPWVKALNIEVVSTGPEESLFRMPLGQHLARVGGIVSGQALAALADTCMVLAAIANAGELKLFATTNLDTQFLRPGTGSGILCRAVIVRAGRALVFARAEMTEEGSGKPVATANATLFAS
ncbi:MAG: PaaI family thioesterase [Rhodobacteraceae bacterium]|nr:MAG: PaaI family thioesterase [Paracoccaceae bacterium]